MLMLIMIMGRYKPNKPRVRGGGSEQETSFSGATMVILKSPE